MKRGATVKCSKEFKTKSSHPYLTFPDLGKEYIVRDTIVHENGEVSYHLFDLTNDFIMTPSGLQEPSFNANNFEIVRLPLDFIEVDKLIEECLNSK
jgi:hypothetical protein